MLIEQIIEFGLRGLGPLVVNIGVARIFDWGGSKPQITCYNVIRNFKRGIFCGGKDIVEWKIRSRGLLLARN